MNWKRAYTIFRKEVLDTLRDKRTLIMMVALPVVLYPAMMLLSMEAVMIQRSKIDDEISRVAIQAEDLALVKGWFAAEEAVEAEREEDDAPEPSKISLITSENPEGDLARGDLDAVVVVTGRFDDEWAAGGTLPVEILFDHTEMSSMEAAGRVRDRLEDAYSGYREERLARSGLTQEYIDPLDIKRTDVAPPDKSTGHILGLILPMIMIMMITMGAFYPAIDLTAGEKERGTFETLLSTPTAKIEIVTGKFMTIFLIAMTTGILNLMSMATTFLLLAAQVEPLLGGAIQFDLNLPFKAFFLIFLVMIPLAFFISALMMAIAVLAKSFKEAQNYATPFMMVIIFPAMLGGMPGSELNATNQFIPIYNATLLFKDLMTNEAGLKAVLAVFGSTTVFAILALQFATWLFQREDVILSEERGIPLTFRRGEFRPRKTLPPSMTIGYFAFILLMLFYGGATVQRWDMMWGLVITEWGFLLATTLLLLWFVRTHWKSALNLSPLSLPNLVGAVVIGLSSTLLVIQVSAWQSQVMPYPEGIEEYFSELLSAQESEWGLLGLFFVVALSPAICEEVVFRGVILSGLRARLGTWPVIFVVGALFGVFHLSIYRFVPTALLGIVLTYLVVRSGSIFAGVLVHALNNGLAILMASDYAPAIVENTLQLENMHENGLPTGVLLGALVGFAIGATIIETVYRRNRRRLEDDEGA